MARRIPTVNGVHTNGNAPPPSTLAAQIVQNQSRPPAPQQNGDTPTFAELLHEILNDHAATPETDVQVNVKLISVVVEAGLAPLADGNPFAQWDVLIPQAIDSIAVIEATIGRQPEVLFSAISPDGPQLLLPLLARLAAVCGRQRCESLPVLRLLNSMFCVLQSSIHLWQCAQTLRQVVEDCVDGTSRFLSQYAFAYLLSQMYYPLSRLLRSPGPTSLLNCRLQEALLDCGRNQRMPLLFLTAARLLSQTAHTLSCWR